MNQFPFNSNSDFIFLTFNMIPQLFAKERDIFLILPKVTVFSHLTECRLLSLFNTQNLIS